MIGDIRNRMKRPGLSAFLFFVLSNFFHPATASSLLPVDTQQLIIVVSPSWSAFQAHVFLCSKNGSRWDKAGPVYDAVIGKKGMGIGDSRSAEAIEPVDSLAAVKKEGDMKTPAGIFELGP